MVSGDGGASAATAAQLPVVQPHAGVGEPGVGVGGRGSDGDGGAGSAGKKKHGGSTCSCVGSTNSGSEETGGGGGVGATSEASVTSPWSIAVGIQEHGASRIHRFLLISSMCALRIRNLASLNW